MIIIMKSKWSAGLIPLTCVVQYKLSISNEACRFRARLRPCYGAIMKMDSSYIIYKTTRRRHSMAIRTRWRNARERRYLEKGLQSEIINVVVNLLTVKEIILLNSWKRLGAINAKGTFCELPFLETIGAPVIRSRYKCYYGITYLLASENTA